MQSYPHLIMLGLLAATGFILIGCGDRADDGKKKYTSIEIVKGNISQYPENIQLIMSAPIPEEVIKSDSVTVELRVGNFEIGMPSQNEQSQGLAFNPDGQNVCVVIDDTMQVTMTSGMTKIGPLKPGRHTLRAFARYSWYESIKIPKAFASYAFYIRTKGADTTGKRKPLPNSGRQDSVPVKSNNDPVPMLTYNSPYIDVSGNDAEHVLLDFFLTNVELGPKKYRVIATVDGKKTDTLTQWCPYYIEGLKPANHTVRIELMGPDGALHGVYERSFNVTAVTMKTEAN